MPPVVYSLVEHRPWRFLILAEDREVVQRTGPEAFWDVLRDVTALVRADVAFAARLAG